MNNASARPSRMKIFYSTTSPFVRKCLVCAHELGIFNRLELVPSNAHPVNRDRTVVAVNPLGKVPTLVTDEGDALYDSRLICEYLNSLGDGRLLPAQGASRWNVLAEQSLADGMLDAAVLMRYESAVRPENLRWNDWMSGQLDKIACGLAAVETRARALGDRVDIGVIALGCALGYLDFRYASLGWREKHPDTAAWFDRFDSRASMMSTRPPAG
jgi:glutathione S-transferase